MDTDRRTESTRAATPSVADLPIPLPAQSLYNRIHKQIVEFEASSHSGESVVVSHMSANGPCVVDNVGYHGPDLIVLGGTDGVGRRIRLLVSLQAVNLTLTAVPPGPEKRRPIGFVGEVAEDEQPPSEPAGA